ncbi:TniQ family protein [Pseudomonas morbosilactucae]|uniref:TniQ family protein n=1 Tax=Pseudomonas morbosilactucae TaxID=2938197 RepID=UPI003CC58DF8
MEAPYTWHPGACCLNPRWPLTPPILPDELFSSWLVRTAHAHGCSPNTLTSAVWPRARAWACDVDRQLSEARIDALARVTGFSAQALAASTLWQPTRVLHPNPMMRRMGNQPWVLPLGSRNQSHAGGLLCCPLCICGPVPHYLLQHRLAWHTACPRHRVLLVDRCPTCMSALQPARLRFDTPLHLCHHCGQSFGKHPTEPMVISALSFQAFADAASRSPAQFGQASVSFSDWMNIARVMVSFLEYAIRHPSDSTRRFCQTMGADTGSLEPSALGLPFEFLAPAERAGLLGQAWVIMQAGPERFMEAAAEARLPVSAFPLSAVGGPELLLQMVSVLVRHSHHSPGRLPHRQSRTPLEVWRMWHRLQRRTRRSGIS